MDAATMTDVVLDATTRAIGPTTQAPATAAISVTYVLCATAVNIIVETAAASQPAARGVTTVNAAV